METQTEAMRLADWLDAVNEDLFHQGVGFVARITALESINQELLAALREMVEVHDEPCRIDHNGRCQSHFLDDVNNGGCRVANAKAVIAKATGETE